MEKTEKVLYTFNPKDLLTLVEDTRFHSLIPLIINSLAECKEYFTITLDIDGEKRIISSI